MIITVKEARKILGKLAKEMTDGEIIGLVYELDTIALDTLRQAREKRMKKDATELTDLLYDPYQGRNTKQQ